MGGIPPLKDAVINEPEDHIKAASAWSLGQIGRHSPDHARALAEADVLRRLLAVYLHQDSSEDLQTKAKRALKSVIQKCTHLPALEPLLQEAPPNILKYVYSNSPRCCQTTCRPGDPSFRAVASRKSRRLRQKSDQSSTTTSMRSTCSTRPRSCSTIHRTTQTRSLRRWTNSARPSESWASSSQYLFIT